jgi:hypothetical protein
VILSPAGFDYSEFSCAGASAISFPLSKHTAGGDTAPAFSGLCVCLQLTWEVSLTPSPVEFSSHCHFYKISRSCFPTPDYWVVLLLLPASVLVYSSHGRWVFPPSCGVFLPPPLSQAFPLMVAGLPQEPLWPAQLVYLQFQEGFPSPNLRCSVRPTLFPACLYCSYWLLLSFSGLGGALLVSLFNVKWRCSALAGGVEGSKFCLFSVVLPARCVSSVSPRFHYRRHAFCFLPLAAILESPLHWLFLR